MSGKARSTSGKARSTKHEIPNEEEEITSDIPRDIRFGILDMIEDLGQIAGLLREAAEDTDRGNVAGGQVCGSDAAKLMGKLEAKASTAAALLFMWSDGRKGGGA